MHTKYYTKTWFIILTLIIFFPLGLFLMWKYNKFNKPVRITITAVLFLFAVTRLFNTPSTPQITKQDGQIAPNSTNSKTEGSSQELQKNTPQPDPIETKVKEFINANPNLNIGKYTSKSKQDNWKSGERYLINTPNGSFQFYFNEKGDVVSVYDVTTDRKRIFNNE